MEAIYNPQSDRKISLVTIDYGAHYVLKFEVLKT